MNYSHRVRSTGKTIVAVFTTITTLVGTLVISQVVTYTYINSKLFVYEIGLACILASALVIGKGSWEKIKTQPIVWGVTAYALALAAALLFSHDKTLSWLGAIDRGTGVMFLLLGMAASIAIGITLSKKDAKRFLLIPIVGAGVIIVGSVWLEVHGAAFLRDAGGGGLIGNSSMAATFLLFAQFSDAYLFLTSRKVLKWMYGIIFLILVCNPVFIAFKSASGVFLHIGAAKGATISLVFGMIVSLGVWLSTKKTPSKKIIGRLIVALSTMIAIVGVLLLVSPHSRLHVWFVDQETSTRFIYWHAAIKGFEAHPLLGTGPETYPYTYQTYFNPVVMLKTSSGEIWSNKPHNAYLQVLSETGTMGAIAYLLLLIGIMVGVRRIYTHGGDAGGMTMFSGLFVAYLLNNLIFFDTITSYYALFLFLAFLISAVPDIPMDAQHTARSFRILRWAIASVVLIVVSITATRQLQKAYRAHEEFIVPLDQRISFYKKVENTSPYGSGLFLAQRADFTYQSVYLPSLQDILKQSKTNQAIVVQAVQGLIDQLKTDMATYPPNEQEELAIGRLASLKVVLLNAPDPVSLATMKAAAQEAIILSPANPQGYLLLGQAYVYEQKYDEAYATFDSARRLLPAFSDPHHALINLALFLHDQKKAALYTQQAINESPDFVAELLTQK